MDPYCGVGSTIIAAIKNNRNAIGIEKHKKYIEIGEERIASLKQDELKYREIGTKVFEPNLAKMAVARKPDHFKY